MDWSSVFDAAFPYPTFLDRHATPAQRARWDVMHDRILLEPDQMALLGGFIRRMPVLVLAGTWCGDCVNQCPIFDRFAAASPAIDLRFLDRDARPEVADALSIKRWPSGPDRPVPERGVPRSRPLWRADPVRLPASRCREARLRMPHGPDSADR